MNKMSTTQLERILEDDFSGYDEEADSLIGDDNDTTTESEAGSVKVAREDIKLMNVVRAIVILVLLTFTFISANAVFVISTVHEQDNFRLGVIDASQQLIEGFHERIERTLLAAKTLTSTLTFSSKTGSFPFVTFTDFATICEGFHDLSAASTIIFNPLVTEEQRLAWETYADLNYKRSLSGSQEYGDINSGRFSYFPSYRQVLNGIYGFVNGTAVSSQATAARLFPAWQSSPVKNNETTVSLVRILFDEMSTEARGKGLTDMMLRRGAAVSSFIYQDSNKTDYAEYHEPAMSIYYPFLGSLDGHNVVGAVNLEIFWSDMLSGLLGDFQEALVAVVACSCGGGKFSFQIVGDDAAFLGAGDLHSISVDGYKPITSNYSDFLDLFANHTAENPGTESCSYQLTVYASTQFKHSYLTAKPDIYRAVVLVVFFLMIAVFLFYDKLVERSQNRVVDAAKRSDAIIQSLFPSNVRDRLYEDAKRKEEMRKKHANDDWKRADINVAEKAEGAGIETPKNRLKKFMNLSPTDQESTSSGGAKATVEPIADLFPNTTVLFADLAGFTAWSSEREPSQVFTLLETLYQSMDKLARKLGVFKVETIGDCYVAASGLPEPQHNHAEIMVRFARLCLARNAHLTRSLEAQLGPGTADLGMRFGIHSGPVTAGVLRGQKARFQLFGDTMNMASRMESTGLKNRIQLSAEAAALITAAGFERWITPRKDHVHVKGKGELQTYWVIQGTSSGSKASTDISDECQPQVSPVRDPSRRNGILSSKQVEFLDRESASDRLIDWNCEVLLGLLKNVVANRAARTSTHSLISSQDEIEITTSHGMILDEVKMSISLPEFNPQVAGRVSTDQVFLSESVRREMRAFIASVAAGYHDNPFHNFEHASHVILSATKLLKRILAADDVGTKNGWISSQELHDHTYGIASDPLTQFAVVFSALIHDVGHTGVPNGRLAEEEPTVASKYHHKCIAEQRSVDLAFDLLLTPTFNNLRACIYQDRRECERFRQLVVNSVLATDIFDKELKALRNLRWDMAFHAINKVESTTDLAHRKATIVIEHIIQASDVSHTMQHWYVYIKWNERLFQEMYEAYLSGRSTKDPSDGWYSGELSFYDNYVIPLAMKLKECGVFGASSDEYLNYAVQNRKEWERKGIELVDKFRATVLSRKQQKARKTSDITPPRPMEDIEELVNSFTTEDETVSHESGHSTSSLSDMPEGDVCVIEAPAGDLGISLEATIDGPMRVHEVASMSPLKGRLRVGDRILAVDGIETTTMSHFAISSLLTNSTRNARRLKVQFDGSTHEIDIEVKFIR